MNHAEAVVLCRFTKSVCPHQQFDQYTPDAWALVLADVRLEDAREAVVEVARRQPFVAPAEIITEVKRIRSKRIDDYGPITPPPELDPDDTAAYRDWWVSAQRAIADGNPPPRPAELPARPMRQIEGTFRRPA